MAQQPLERDSCVYLRLRPTARRGNCYSTDGNIFKTRLVENPAQNALQRDVQEKHFTFSDIFQDSASQKDVYDTCCFKAIENDENLTVLTYGTSGSGKTFTLLGMFSENPGIIPRAIEHIFTKYSDNISNKPAIKLDKGNVIIVEDKDYSMETLRRTVLISKNKKGAQDYAQQKQCIQKDHDFQKIGGFNAMVVIWVSFAELYNDNVYDLLVPEVSSKSAKEKIAPTIKRKNLRIISNDGNAFIKDLVAIHCRNSSDAYLLLATGLKNISYASTNVNKHSSRSHCIFIVEVIKYHNQFEFDHTTYKFCDLAGSERQKKTESVGNRLKEAQSINHSLMVLGRCLDAVYHNSSIVPIRDSKLTVLLQASLQGREKITMIVNLLPTSTYYEENLNVLNFASMAKKIVYKAPVVAKKTLRTSRFSIIISQTTITSPTASLEVGDGCDDSQVSVLLDDNERLKQEIHNKIAMIENLKVQMDDREMQMKIGLVTDHEQRMKRLDVLWNKRLDLAVTTTRQEVENAKMRYQESLDDIPVQYQQSFAHLNEVWEKLFAEVEAKHGVQQNRPSADYLNRCSVIEVPVMRNTILPNDESIKLVKTFCESIEISDDSECETSGDSPKPKWSPTKRNRIYSDDYATPSNDNSIILEDTFSAEKQESIEISDDSDCEISADPSTDLAKSPKLLPEKRNRTTIDKAPPEKRNRHNM